MANEISVSGDLRVNKGNLLYNSSGGGYNADLSGTVGPTPGSISVATSGTTVNLEQLTGYGGFCRIKNNDLVNYVEYGVHDGAEFFPFGELRPGEAVVIRLSRNIEYGSAGTALSNTFRIRANTAACIVQVDVFDA